MKDRRGYLGMKAPIATEHQEQRALIEWWAHAHKQFGVPEFALFAIPNGGLRHVAVACKLKAEGVRSGCPDLMLAVPRGGAHGLFVEMKRTKGSQMSAEQKDFLAYLSANGYTFTIAKGFEQARFAITRYLGPVAESAIDLPLLPWPHGGAEAIPTFGDIA